MLSIGSVSLDATYPYTLMQEVEAALRALDQLCTTVKAFSLASSTSNNYRAPIIDHFHTHDYTQRSISGISRFASHVRAERDYVEGILRSGHAPADFTTNTPNLLAVWDEVENAPKPILLVSQMLDIDDEVYEQKAQGQIKLDVIADGGNEWIKVSTIKETRLMAEFREQDSYVNSDYDSDSDSEHDTTPTSTEEGGLTNSLIKQARTLADAAKQFRRPQGLPQPRVRFVLTRLLSENAQSYDDERIPRTFEAIRQMGVDLVLADQLPRPPSPSPAERQPVLPTRNILLDLSVLVALCCDSTHHPLPNSEAELEARFRALQLPSSSTGELALAPHNNVTRDLRDQLSREYEHALVGELQYQLEQRRLRDAGTSSSGSKTQKVQFWVTEEVMERLPNIVEVIGGEKEKARARAMFRDCPNHARGRQQEGSGDELSDFWEHSRWKGKAPDLGDVRIKVLPDGDDQVDSVDFNDLTLETETKTASQIPFNLRLVRACENMLAAPGDTVLPPTPLHKQKHKRSKHPARSGTVFPTSRSPSPHTLNSFIAGAKRGWTVLTNNRGAVGKIVRDMGVLDGIPYDHEGMGGDEWAVVWVVNPSSLSEWRRIEVEESNKALVAATRTAAPEAVAEGTEAGDPGHASSAS